MTARVSSGCPSGPHRRPPFLIMAGMEASMMTSLGTCRLVTPRSESTMETRGPAASSASTAERISSPWGRASSPARTAPRPSSARSPAASRASPWVAKTPGSVARTA